MKKLLLGSLTILFCTSIVAQNAINLKLNLEKNRLYRLKSVSEQTVSQTVNGVQQSTEVKVSYTLSLKMIDATADFMVAEVHFDTLITKTNAMGKLISASSVGEGDIKSAEMGDVLSCIMNRLSKNAIYVKLDFSGKPLEIVNQKMLSGMVLKDTSSITIAGQTGVAIKKQIAELVSESNLETLIGMFTWRLPATQVSEGDNWKMTQQMNSGGMELDILTTCHLDGITGNSANITADSDIKAKDNADPIESGGAKVTYDDLRGLNKSNMVINVGTGLLVRETTKTHITGNLGISAPGFSMQMPMDINGESKIVELQ